MVERRSRMHSQRAKKKNAQFKRRRHEAKQRSENRRAASEKKECVRTEVGVAERSGSPTTTTDAVGG